MAIKKKATGTYRLPSKRRTFAEISKLTHDAVKAELLTVGLKPLELVSYVPHYGIGPDPRPRLEQHQRYDYSEYDRLADDPFENEYRAQQRQKAPGPYDAVNTDYFWLYSHELDRYVDALPLSTITKKLASFRKDDRLSSIPQRHWGEKEYRREMASRINQHDHDAFEASHVAFAPATKKTRKRGAT